jgi:hypothetical protein
MSDTDVTAATDLEPPAEEPQAEYTPGSAPGADEGTASDGAALPPGTPGGQTNAIESLHAETVEFTSHQNISQYFSAQRTTIRQFSARDAIPLSAEEERESAVRFRGADSEVEELLLHLTERRVLLLSAVRGARKTTAATCLAWHLRSRGECTGPTLQFNSPRTHARIDLLQLAQKDPDLEGRVLIFRDAFTTGNADLAGLFEKTDRQGWDQLARRLRERGAYLVFTSCPAEVEAFRDAPAVRPLVRELSPHPRQVLERALEARLASVESRREADPELASALRRHRERLVARFPYAALLDDFVDFFVDLDRPGLDIIEAERQFEDTGRWLLNELDGDSDGWTFGFTLALAQCARDADGVPWVDFDRLHRLLRQWLRRDMELPARDGEGEDTDPTDVRLELSDDSLLKRCNAVVVKDEETLADMIRFRDGGPPVRLWEQMLRRHRRVLTALLPRLRTLAERLGHDPADQSLRNVVASIIGRIGELDPQRIVLPVIARWCASNDARQVAALGPLMEGVLGSRHERVRTTCLGHLQSLQRDAVAVAMRANEGAAAGASQSRGGARAGGKPNTRLLAIIGAYSWIGDYELALAMRELGDITGTCLGPAFLDPEKVGVGLAAAEDVAAAKLLAGPEWQEKLLIVLAVTLKERKEVFFGIKSALVSLSLTAGPVPVLRAMGQWMTEGGWQTGTLLALMFTYRLGIAHDLMAERVEVPATSDRRAARVGFLVETIATTPGAARLMATFLADLYQSLVHSPGVNGRLRHLWMESLMEHLTEWVRETVELAEYREGMKRLFESLARTHDGILRERVAQLLARRAFAGGTPQMRAFAASVDLAGEGSQVHLAQAERACG